MEAVFLQVLNMGICAGWIVLAVLVLRLLVSRAPKWIQVLLWGFVALRLLIPDMPESPVSIVPSAQTLPQQILTEQVPYINSGIPAVNRVVNPPLQQSLTPAVGASVNPAQIWTAAGSAVWLLGMTGMLLYALVSYLRIRYTVREAAKVTANIWECDAIATPFILGLFRPRIYLPTHMAGVDRDYVVAHEQAHLKRLDHIWKPVGFFLLSVYWFHPLLWLAYILLCRDIEMACDQRVIRSLGPQARKPYSQALIRCSLPRGQIAACPLAFGEVSVRQRIRGILHYRKSAFWILLVSILVLVGASVFLLTNPMPVRLCQIEKLNLSYTLDQAQYAMVYQGNRYCVVYDPDEDMLDQLGELPISRAPVNSNRPDWQDMPHAIALKITTSSVWHYPSLVIGFNTDFTQVMADDGVKPTQCYRVLDPKTARSIYECLYSKAEPVLQPQLQTSEIYRFADGAESATLLLSQLGNGCALSTRDAQVLGTYSEIEDMLTLDTPQGRITFRKENHYHQILDLPNFPGIPLFAFGSAPEPLPLLADGSAFIWLPTTDHVLDSILFDIDEDGRQETCMILDGATSGFFTFAMVAAEGTWIEYGASYCTDPAQLRFAVLDGKLKVKTETTYPEPMVRWLELEPKDGELLLTWDGKPVDLGLFFAPKT